MSGRNRCRPPLHPGRGREYCGNDSQDDPERCGRQRRWRPHGRQCLPLVLSRWVNHTTVPFQDTSFQILKWLQLKIHVFSASLTLCSGFLTFSELNAALTKCASLGHTFSSAGTARDLAKMFLIFSEVHDEMQAMSVRSQAGLVGHELNIFVCCLKKKSLISEGYALFDASGTTEMQSTYLWLWNANRIDLC